MRFTLADSSTDNRYGFRVLVDGIDTTQFVRNPVMLYRHLEEDKDDMPIGKWNDLVMDNGRMTAEPEFDPADKFAIKVKSKVDGGYIRMASVGLIPLEWSDSDSYKIPGQTGPTLIKSRLREASICPFGMNWNALRLYDQAGKLLNLSDSIFLDKIQTKNTNEMSEIIKSISGVLNLSDSATSSDIIAATIKLSEQHKELTKELSEAKTKLEEVTAKVNNAEKEVLLSEAVKEKRITEKEKGVLLKLEAEDIKIALSERKPADNLPNIPAGAADSPLLKMSYQELDKAGKLEELRSVNLEGFKEKFKAEFGVDYKE